MQRIEAIRHMAQVVTKDDLLTTSIGQTWDDWWNHKPADNTFFTGILGSVTPTALGLAVEILTDWTSASRGPIFLSYRANEGTIAPDVRLLYLPAKCSHYPLELVGDPEFVLL